MNQYLQLALSKSCVKNKHIPRAQNILHSSALKWIIFINARNSTFFKNNNNILLPVRYENIFWRHLLTILLGGGTPCRPYIDQSLFQFYDHMYVYTQNLLSLEHPKKNSTRKERIFNPIIEATNIYIIIRRNEGLS